MTNPVEAARKGAELLDAKRPQWFTEVDPETLNIDDATRCVLGQLPAHYHRSVQEYGLWEPPPTNTLNYPFPPIAWEYEHGFLTADDAEPLNAAWRAEIEVRRAAADTREENA